MAAKQNRQWTTGVRRSLYFLLGVNYCNVDAGCADCVHYAEVELLAEQLASNLGDFQLHKIVKLPHEWSVRVVHLCCFISVHNITYYEGLSLCLGLNIVLKTTEVPADYILIPKPIVV